ncbi:hypothetical protein HOP50_01g01780 [Chloropicon primus]|uniref:DUF1826 domain-containing protein n=1 Tax=Chloropicon primus TaxID=1764295 RepID=A0A5B8MC00_9CHLO|nr:hypothetical protein A3770_01p01890 [Chloropicon primus]UPQ96887.1 hypothetical protein HOP50_01g01780 [Chloropicon primus]|eukprot:QDZ17671.1 hypothetical protein A3770_01p01890 [Chloropicon primus]
MIDEGVEVARGLEVPPAIAVAPLRALRDVEAREELRSWLSGARGRVIEAFEALAYLTPEALLDRARASEELRAQLALEERFSLEDRSGRPSSNAIVDDVLQDVLHVCEAHALSMHVGCTVTVALHRSTTCPLLHQDNVEQRAICTLLGRGTEWLSEPELPKTAAIIEAVNAAQDQEDYACARAHKKKLEATAAFAAAGERETVLIRGCKWPGAERQAPLHRSPHLARNGKQFRLVVKVDSGRGLPGQMQRRMRLDPQRVPLPACGVLAERMGKMNLLKTF